MTFIPLGGGYTYQQAPFQRSYQYQAPDGYAQTYDPTNGMDLASMGFSAMNQLPQQLSNNALMANSLSSANFQSSMPALASMYQSDNALRMEQLRQNAINQRFGPLTQLLAGFANSMRGGSSGFQGFSSNFGQSAQPGH